MRAIILAAGQGTRLRPLTNDRPKCLVELFGVPLLERQKRVLARAGIEDVTVVTGYRGEMVKLLGYRTIENPRYASTNMLATLFCASHLLDGVSDVIISYGDIVYEPKIISALLGSNAPVSVAVDRNWYPYWCARMDEPMKDAETLRMDKDERLVELGRRPTELSQIEGQYIGLIKVRKDFAKKLSTVYASLDRQKSYDGQDFDNMYMTSFLQVLIDLNWPVYAASIKNGWLEVDTTEDLITYDRLHQQGKLVSFFDLNADSG